MFWGFCNLGVLEEVEQSFQRDEEPSCIGAGEAIAARGGNCGQGSTVRAPLPETPPAESAAVCASV